ncbi:MAG: hypothetical protein ACI8UO_000013 [Verrucomicrobiales bacterium]|jgi:hypothetical protein
MTDIRTNHPEIESADEILKRKFPERKPMRELNAALMSPAAISTRFHYLKLKGDDAATDKLIAEAKADKDIPWPD